MVLRTAELRYVAERCGAQYAVIIGAMRMQQLPVDN